MYYSYLKLGVLKTFQIACVAFLIISITPCTGFSDNLKENRSVEAEKYRVLGYQAQQKGNMDEALTFYSKAVELGFSSPVLFNDIGVVYEQLGLADPAEQFYLKAIQADQKYLPPYTNLAYLYKSLERTSEAIYYFQQRIERASEDDPWLPRLIAELQKIDPNYKQKVVIKQLDQMHTQIEEEKREQLELEIGRVKKHMDQAEVFWSEGRFEEALQELKNAERLSPENPQVLELLKKVANAQLAVDVDQRAQKALGMIKAGDLESARQEYQNILAVIPDK
jgi:tetratricopeptide (TPR) repeat protein